MSKKFIIVTYLLFLLIVFSYTAFAVKEGETEFFEFNKQKLALTVVKVYPDNTADLVLSKEVPEFTKALNEGESQKYMSNWQCFVVTLKEVLLSGKSNVLISRCAGEEKEELPTKVEPIKPIEFVEAVKSTQLSESVESTEPADSAGSESKQLVGLSEFSLKSEPIEETPILQENLFDTKVSLGTVLLIFLVVLALIMIILFSVFVYVRNN
ncbi:MAG: hypothetical protein ABIG89_00785 [Candidatus Woesearchaeota archaeon]